MERSGNMLSAVEAKGRKKRALLASLAFFAIGFLPLINSLNNPRLAGLHVPDYLRLIAAGLWFGLALGVFLSVSWGVGRSNAFALGVTSEPYRTGNESLEHTALAGEGHPGARPVMYLLRHRFRVGCRTGQSNDGDLHSSGHGAGPTVHGSCAAPGSLRKVGSPPSDT